MSKILLAGAAVFLSAGLALAQTPAPATQGPAGIANTGGASGGNSAAKSEAAPVAPGTSVPGTAPGVMAAPGQTTQSVNPQAQTGTPTTPPRGTEGAGKAKGS